jgi:hypothetical protein
MMSYSLNEVLEALKPTYASIDLRALIVSLGDGSGWRNVFTVARMSRKSQDEVNEEHARLVHDYDIPASFLTRSLDPWKNSEPFRGMNLELSSYPADSLSHVFGRLGEGLVRCSRRTIRVWATNTELDPLPQRAEFRFDSYATDGNEWDVFYFGQVQQGTQLLGEPKEDGERVSIDQGDLDGWAREAGFSHFRALCEGGMKARFGVGHKF